LGQEVRGAVAPLGLSVIIGAFLFGVGMQLGGGCASGTLYSAGGGSTRMFVTLAAFIAGSVLGVLHTPFWDDTPSYAPVSLVDRFGVVIALAMSLALFATVATVSWVVEQRAAASSTAVRHERYSVIHGPWPLVAGALGLAAVNIATLLL